MKTETSSLNINLYGCNEYVGDIWKGAIYLSNLDDEKCIEELKKNYDFICREEGIKKRKHQARLTYHKITYTSSKTIRTSNFYEGFFVLELYFNTKIKRKCYTTFKGVINCIERENQSIKSFEVTSGYSRHGEHLKKARGGVENE